MLTKLKLIDISRTQITDAGCAALVVALDGGMLPALEDLTLDDTLTSEAATATPTTPRGVMI